MGSKELVALIGELYRRDEGTRQFLHARFDVADDDARLPYREQVGRCMNPEGRG